MAVSNEMFVAAYPEFADAPDDVLTAALSAAVRRTDASVYGDKYDDGVMLRAADTLARSPFARPMKLVEKDGTTSYRTDLIALMTMVGAGVGRIT